MSTSRVFSLVLALVFATACADKLQYSSVKGSVLVNGETVQLKGVNWYGYETTTGLFHGLWAQPASVYLDFLADNGFNAVRVPLDLDLMLNDREHGYVQPEPWEANSPENNCSTALAWSDATETYYCPSQLMAMSSLETLDWFVGKFAELGILVLLDMHCLDTSGTSSSPVFFNDQFSRNDTLAGWVAMAERYQDAWNVMGADVFNEPFGATWAEGEETDMDQFSVDVAAAIHGAGADNWLIFVEGAFKDPNCTQVIDGDTVSCGYGDNLLGVAADPVVLQDGSEDKLVYSVHTYGPSQHDRAEFNNSDFPNNMADVWDAHWGYITEDEDAPAVVLGEWGGPTNGTNGEWMSALVQYLIGKDLRSNFFWCLNEDGSPQGLYTNWSTTPAEVDEDKLTVLATLTPEPSDILALAGIAA